MNEEASKFKMTQNLRFNNNKQLILIKNELSTLFKVNKNNKIYLRKKIRRYQKYFYFLIEYFM
jgi:hypothetical protein